MQRYCLDLLEKLWDDDLSVQLFEQAAESIRAVAKGNLHRDNIRVEPFTVRLLEVLGATNRS